MSDNKGNSCAFYVSDYHLEMIMLPYINENIKKNRNVYVFTQNNLEETMNKVVSRVNLEDDVKKEILKINWKNDDEVKYNNLIKDEKEITVFVKGNEKYIKKVNGNLNQISDYKNLEIIDCYNLEEVENKSSEIVRNYGSILKTQGKLYI